MEPFWASRTHSSALLVSALTQYPNHVKAVVSASAIGWYGADKNGKAGLLAHERVDVLNFANGAIRRGGEIIVVGLFGGKFAAPIPTFPGRPYSIVGSYTGPLGETREMMELVKTGKIAPIPVEMRPLDQADKTLNQLREGTIVGRVVLKP